MSAQIDPQDFVRTLLPIVRQCAQTSLIFYGKVANIGKAEDTTLDSWEGRQASSALTVIDNALQDIILNTVVENYPDIRCIAEEDTPIRRRFAGNKSKYTLILDPIDGTIHFVQGDAAYHICVGLACDGYMEASIIARPTEDKIFTAIRGHGSFVQIGTQRRRRLRLGRTAKTKRAYLSTKARAYHKAAQRELVTQEHPVGAALALTGVAEGTFCAYFTRQVEVHDVGPPSLIAEEAGARCFLRDNRSPRYHTQRKFGLYRCAATPELEVILQEILRTGARSDGA